MTLQNHCGTVRYVLYMVRNQDLKYLTSHTNRLKPKRCPHRRRPKVHLRLDEGKEQKSDEEATSFKQKITTKAASPNKGVSVGRLSARNA